MKELTIEEKAQRYDEAIERLRNTFYDNNGRMCEEYRKAVIRIIEPIFPELKESEDERMRRQTIKVLNYYKDEEKSEGRMPTEIDECIAWLERWSKASKVEEAMREVEEKAKAFTEAHKGETSEEIIAQMRGEQKPTDKIESKFHEGEWLCENEPNNYARFMQILETVNAQGEDRYRISRDIHKDEDVVEFGFVEKYYHKFDIKDAKDGDVLYDNYTNTILIFKSQTCGWIKVYCDYWINKNKFTGTCSDDYGRVSEMDFQPATKEQRDLLFQKMKEAGYEWDEEKKELKKIELDPAWSEEDEEMYKEVLTDIIYAKNDLEAKECLGLSKRAKKAFNWFSKRYKSLRTQNTWRPTKEQIEALGKHLIFLQRMNAFGENADRLKDLYNDLKNLTKE